MLLSTLDSTFLLFSLWASLVSGAPTKQPLSRRAITHYQAFGDSYSAAPGAGNPIRGAELCKRFDGGYPYQLYALLNSGGRIPDQDVLSCTGATAEEIEQHSEFMDPNADLITISLGGNNVGFGDIVNSCVYRFAGPIGAVDCNLALSTARYKIETQLDGPVGTTLKTFLGKSTNKDLKMFVTGYAKFWNAETTLCDKVSWNYWDANGDKMDQDRRRQMNDLVDSVNTRLANLVASLNDPRIQFINYDDSYNNNRFCEEGVIEPQEVGEDRPNLHIHQLATPVGQIQPNTTFPGSEPASSFARNITAVEKAQPDAKPANAYSGLPMPVGPDSLPIWIVKVFHPTILGHSKIAQAVFDAINKSPTGGPIFKPLPAETTAACGGNLGLNFPPWFALIDKQAAVAEILFRRRDQACLGGCQSIQGVPGNLMAAKKVSDSGCEFAVKLSQGKELYLFVTHSGDNCYKATEKMINTCMTDKNDGNPIHDSTWINGPNYGEFYQSGVRALNDPKGTHDPMTTVPNEHLGYTHVQCRRTDGFLYESYSINLSGWDDGQYGQTILNKVRECGLSPTGWKYEAGTDAQFADGTKNDHWAAFNMVISNGGCAESKIEEAMGLRGGGLDCPIGTGNYFELDLMA